MADAAASALAGKRIIVTRAAFQSDSLCNELTKRGAHPLLIPAVSIAPPEDYAPLDDAIRGWISFDWIVITSANAVRAVRTRSTEINVSLLGDRQSPRIAAVGPISADAVADAGLRVDFVAATHNGVALAHELGEQLRNRTVLLPRSDRANPDLPIALRQYGAIVTEVIAYRTVAPTSLSRDRVSQITHAEADAVLFFSPSAVTNFSQALAPLSLREMQEKLAIAAVGPVTARALQDAGVHQFILSADSSEAAVVSALENYFANRANPIPSGAKHA